MTASRKEEDYRPCVGIMLLSRQDEVFVAQRIDSPGPAWQMPQGGIDAGETPEQAAFRELKEEIGTDRAQLLHALPNWFYYDLPEELRGKMWGGKFRGQRQKWFILRFLGEEGDINLATEHPEFSRWKWAKAQELPELIVPFKRALYTELAAYLNTFLAQEKPQS